MSKVMFVTVGTSLFHSASWEKDEAILRDVPEYYQWTADDDVLKEPEARKRTPAARRIQAELEKRLKYDNTPLWVQRLAKDLTGGNPDLNTVMRYSAELATILKLFETEAGTDQSLEDFLRSYDHIYLPCDSSDQGTAKLPRVAAHHLAAYLNLLAGNEGLLAQPLAVAGLSSTVPETLLGENTGIKELGKRLLKEEAEQLDLISSGGYKLYGIYLYQLLVSKSLPVRLFYIHEDAGRLVKMENDETGSRVGLF
jgi:hypothetical protein